MTECNENCRYCGGKVYFYVTDDVYSPRFGQLEECPIHRRNRYDEAIGISYDEAKMLNWYRFEKTDVVRTLKTALISVLERGFGLIYIHGEPGIGKTIMVKAAVILAQHRYDYPAQYVRLSAMMNSLRSNYGTQTGQADYLKELEKLCSVQVLCVDEMGRDRQTDFSKQTLSELMDRRYTLATSKKGITIFTSNYSPELIFEPYIVDRIRDGRFQVISLGSPSLRPAMQYTEIEPTEWWKPTTERN